MGEISVTIGGRNYPIVCDDGQEAHVAKLAAYLDKQAAEIGKSVGRVGEGRLLVMVSLKIADELADAYDEIDRMQGQAKDAEKTIRANAESAVEAKLVPIVETIAGRIESVAGRLESD